MKIDKINLRGIRELYGFYANIYKEPNAKMFVDGRRKNILMDTVSISFVVSEISPVEFLMLQSYTSGNAICGKYGEAHIEENTMDDHIAVAEKDIAVMKKVDVLSEQMARDEDLINAAIGTLHYPAMETCSAIVTFRGIQVLSLLQCENTFLIFKNWLGDLILYGTPDENKAFPPYKFPTIEDVFDNPTSLYRPKESFEDHACKKFITGFYQHFHEMVNLLDLVSDSYIHSSIYDDIHCGEVRFLELITPSTTIKMTGDNAFQRKILEIKEILSPDGGFIGENLQKMDFFKIRVTTRQSFGTFLYIIRNYPFDFIRDWCDLKIVMDTSATVPIERLDKYKVRIDTLYNMIRKYQEEIREMNPMMAYNYIPYGTPITFTLEATITDWERYIAEWEMVDGEDGTYVRNPEAAEARSKESLFDFELGKIFRQVSNYIRAVGMSILN